jgi:hypothetical protein
MGVSLEPVVFAARYGDMHKRYGDEYSGSMLILVLDKHAHLIALTGQTIAPYRTELEKLLKAYGVEKVTFQRRKDGKIKDVSLSL